LRWGSASLIQMPAKVYGNSLGHKLLEDHEALKAEIARAAAHRDRMTQDLAETKWDLAETNRKLAGTEQDLTMWKARSTALEARQGVQGRAIEGYLKIRNRFIDTEAHCKGDRTFA
jgi:phage shock protein A